MGGWRCVPRRVIWGLCLECSQPDVCDKLTSCPPNHFNFDGDNSNGCEGTCMKLGFNKNTSILCFFCSMFFFGRMYGTWINKLYEGEVLCFFDCETWLAKQRELFRGRCGLVFVFWLWNFEQVCLVNYSFRVTWKNDVFSSFFKILVAKTPKHENSMWEKIPW